MLCIRKAVLKRTASQSVYFTSALNKSSFMLITACLDAASNASDVNAAQQEIKDMMNKMSLIEDDIKGAAVDKNV